MLRYWTNTAIQTARSEEDRLYKKLANYVPDEKLGRDDIGQLLFILRHYNEELEDEICELSGSIFPGSL